MAVAVKVIILPWHTVLAEEVMEIPTGRDALDTIVTGLDVTGLLPLIQAEFDVSWHVMTSPFVGL